MLLFVVMAVSISVYSVVVVDMTISAVTDVVGIVILFC